MGKNDLKILMVLAKNECYNQIKSYKVRRLVDSTSLSPTKIRNSITLMLQLSFVAKGLPDGNASTYYITQKGMQFLREVQK